MIHKVQMIKVVVEMSFKGNAKELQAQVVNATFKNEEVKTISSREVAEMMEVEHSKLLRKIDTINNTFTKAKIGSSKYWRESSYIDSTWRTLREFEVTKLGCEFLANKCTGEKGIIFTDRYIERFHKMEDFIKDNIKTRDSYMIEDPVERAKAWIKEEEHRQALKLQIEADKPKVIFADAVSTSKTTVLVGELAKIMKQNGIDIGEKRLFTWLRENGYLIKRKGTDYNSPTQKSLELGILEIKEGSHIHSDGHVTITKTPKVTGKGQQYFINKFLNKTEVK